MPDRSRIVCLKCGVVIVPDSLQQYPLACAECNEPSPGLQGCDWSEGDYPADEEKG
jgi:hypothetical protein